MKAVVADPIGGPENLKYIDLETPQPGQGEVLIRLESIGVNFIDVYFRKGFYKAPEHPVKLGNEGAGTVAAAGPGTDWKAGQRVAYTMVRGSYAEFAVVPQQFLVEVPEAVSLHDAGAVMLQGMTAHYLTHSTFPLRAGQTCLVHAAAGGTGQLIVQMAKIAGAHVIATSSSHKTDLLKQLGPDHIVSYDQQDFAAEAKRITGGAGVDVVYDSVGKETFHHSLDCLKPRGMMVSFGQSSGPVGEIDPLLLAQKGSLYLTRPNLAHYISDPKELAWRSSDIFKWIAEGRLTVNIYKEYPLQEAAEAQRDLESRKTTGKLLLLP